MALSLGYISYQFLRLNKTYFSKYSPIFFHLFLTADRTRRLGRSNEGLFLCFENFIKNCSEGHTCRGFIKCVILIEQKDYNRAGTHFNAILGLYTWRHILYEFLQRNLISKKSLHIFYVEIQKNVYPDHARIIYKEHLLSHTYSFFLINTLLRPP